MKRHLNLEERYCPCMFYQIHIYLIPVVIFHVKNGWDTIIPEHTVPDGSCWCPSSGQRYGDEVDDDTFDQMNRGADDFDNFNEEEIEEYDPFEEEL